MGSHRQLGMMRMTCLRFYGLIGLYRGLVTALYEKSVTRRGRNLFSLPFIIQPMDFRDRCFETRPGDAALDVAISFNAIANFGAGRCDGGARSPAERSEEGVAAEEYWGRLRIHFTFYQ